MCSRCRTSWGASEHMTSIASWSPRKSEPLTVSYAWLRQSSFGLIAALMPPAAATECERTGWTLLRIATVAPASAAARAARWPARPGPMIRTSCWGIVRSTLFKALQRPLRGHGGDRLAHPGDRHDARQAAARLDHGDRAHARERRRSEERAKGRIGRQRSVLLVRELPDGQHRLSALDGHVD